MSYDLKPRLSMRAVHGMVVQSGFQVTRNTALEYEALMSGFMHLASLIEASEREACARVCEEHLEPGWEKSTNHEDLVAYSCVQECVYDIRARSEKLAKAETNFGPIKMQYDAPEIPLDKEAEAREREACINLIIAMRAQSNNHLFRSALTIAEGEIRTRGGV